MISGSPFPELRAGNLGVRIAVEPAEVDAVQALRYRVFYSEMGAKADPVTDRDKRDRDMYDAVADHLLVVDHAIGSGPEGVVGTYRLIRRPAANKIGQFYSADEYDLAVIERTPGNSWNWAAPASTLSTATGRSCNCSGVGLPLTSSNTRST